MAERIIEHDSVDMYKSDQAKYSVVVNRRRSLPAIQDGLKPVQKRIIYDAYLKHLTSPNKRDKSTALMGDVMGRLHAHGSQAIYEAMVTMARWFSIKYPLLYGHGNWGSSIGDGAAADRYTECALSNFGYDVLIDDLAQSDNIVDWIDTYKRNGEKEPEYLPAKLPLLLINGSFGIGVGIQCSIPSHNLGDVVDATVALIKNPNTNICLIPDLNMPCELIDTDWQEICNTGNGSFKARGIINTEQDSKGNYILHINSLPHQVNGYRVHELIGNMISNKQLPMVKDLLISVNEKEMPDIIVKLKPGSDPEYVKHVLYTKAQVQASVRVNFEVVAPNGIDIQRYSYRDYLLQFIDMRMNIKFRLYCNKLQQVMTRHYKVDAFIKVIESGQIHKIIDMIRKYKGTDETPIIEYMIKTCNITDIQAKFIISVNLSRLSAGHLSAYKAERKDLEAKISVFKAAITDDGSIIKAEIIQELQELKKKYNTPKTCKVIAANDAEDIPAGMFKVVVTERNFIRKVADSDKVGIVRKDNPKFITRIDNRENLLLFDNKGKVFKIPVSKIPLSDKTSPGTDVRILIRNLTADIAAVYDEEIFKKISKSTNKHYLTILTKSNTIKKLDIEDFLNISPSGLMYSKIKPEDEVVGIALVPHNLDIVICSGKKALRCSLKDVPLFKRNATGSKAMGTELPINGLSVFYPNCTDVVVVTKNGKFNRFPAGMLDRYSRARKGVNMLKLDAGDEIIAVYGANVGDKIRVLTSEGVEEVPVDSIKSKSTVVVGTKMLKSKGVVVRADIVY